MKSSGSISDSELQLMKIIWANGGRILYSDMMEKLSEKEMQWKKNTVLTLLSRLIEKNFLKAEKIGRRNQYIALVSEQEYLSAQTASFLDKLYEGHAKNLLATLVQEDCLSYEDYKELESFWKEAKQKK